MKSNSGHTISADVLIPNEAGEENPLPAIVWAHGGNANKERSDNFQIEWARRGYVVVSFDLYGHGESEVFKMIQNGLIMDEDCMIRFSMLQHCLMWMQIELQYQDIPEEAIPSTSLFFAGQ